MAPDLIVSLIIAQTGDGAANGHLSWWDIIAGAGPMVKFVMLLLAWFSIMCWGIMVLKYIQFRRAREANEKFLEVFWSGSSLDSIYRESKNMTSSSLAQVFKSGFQELTRLKKSKSESAGETGIVSHLGGGEIVERALRRGVSNQRGRLERYLSFLATTGSTAPFVGLFGTVWGIMTSFRHIAVMGDVGLEVVAPGISEALIATAAGLAAAIPAVVAYNYFLAHARAMVSEMDGFSSDILNIIERHFL